MTRGSDEQNRKQPAWRHRWSDDEVGDLLAALAQVEGQLATVTALEQKWRKTEAPGALSEMGLRAERQRHECAEQLAAALTGTERCEETPTGAESSDGEGR